MHIVMKCQICSLNSVKNKKATSTATMTVIVYYELQHVKLAMISYFSLKCLVITQQSDRDVLYSANKFSRITISTGEHLI